MERAVHGLQIRNVHEVVKDRRSIFALVGDCIIAFLQPFATTDNLKIRGGIGNKSRMRRLRMASKKPQGLCPMKLTLPFVVCQTEDGVRLLGFADSEFDTNQYLTLQRTIRPDRQDRAMGMDKPYVELNSQMSSDYGDVEQAEIGKGRLLLRLAPKLAKAVSKGETIEIDFGENVANFDEIVSYLRLIVGPEHVRLVDES